MKNSKPKKLGFNFQSKFSSADKELIEESSMFRISEMVKAGNIEGQLNGEEPDYTGWWWVEMQDENAESEVARNISRGNIQGFYPHFQVRANIWKH